MEPASRSVGVRERLRDGVREREAAGATGQDLITAAVLAYEIQCRLCDAASLRKHGWDHVTYGAISSAVAGCKLLKLDPVQTTHAIGLAGVAEPAKLLRVSTRIGLSDSARFLRGHSNWFMRMVQPGGYDPERFATALLPELAAPDRNVAGLHFFTFNEIEATERWRRETLARLLAS